MLPRRASSSSASPGIDRRWRTGRCSAPALRQGWIRSRSRSPMTRALRIDAGRRVSAARLGSLSVLREVQCRRALPSPVRQAGRQKPDADGPETDRAQPDASRAEVGCPPGSSSRSGRDFVVSARGLPPSSRSYGVGMSSGAGTSSSPISLPISTQPPSTVVCSRSVCCFDCRLAVERGRRRLCLGEDDLSAPQHPQRCRQCRASSHAPTSTKRRQAPTASCVVPPATKRWRHQG